MSVLLPGLARLAVAALLLAPAVAAHAQAPQGPTGAPLPVAPADPAIASAIARISPDLIRADIARLVSFGNRSTLSSMDTTLPAGTGITPAADWIFSEFTRISADCGNCLQVERDDFIEPASAAPGSRIRQDTRLQNIYAVLPGTDPAQAPRRILVTGHYDSRATDVTDTHTPAPGANDDASGTAVSLEAARVLSKMHFPATLVFVAVAGEEQGLNGSRHLARLARSEGWQLEAALNNDIVGGDKSPGQDPTTVRVFSEGVPASATPEQIRAILALGAESDSPSRELARAIADVDRTYFTSTLRPTGIRRGPRLPGPAPETAAHSGPLLAQPSFHVTLVFRRDRFLRGGDHTSFNAEGFAAVRFTEWQENFTRQHQNPRTENGIEYGDFLAHVDLDYVADVARLNAAALATFASAPGEPEDVRILTRNLDNNTELTWKPPTGAPAGTRYEVLWRDTSAPDWTDAQSAGTATSLTLGVSKDNVIFAVRSLDPAGHRSPAVLPHTAR